MLGTPIDRAKVDCDSFHIACVHRPHHAVARRLHLSTQVLGGDKQMAVVKSGHIQSFVNPDSEEPL